MISEKNILQTDFEKHSCKEIPGVKISYTEKNTRGLRKKILTQTKSPTTLPPPPSSKVQWSAPKGELEAQRKPRRLVQGSEGRRGYVLDQLEPSTDFAVS